MRGYARISSVYGQGPSPDPMGSDAERRNHAARGEAWHRLGLVVIDPEDIGDEWLRRAVLNEAERRYGRRKARSANLAIRERHDG